MIWPFKKKEPKYEIKYRRIRKPKKDEIILLEFPDIATATDLALFKLKWDEEMKKDNSTIFFSGAKVMFVKKDKIYGAKK